MRHDIFNTLFGLLFITMIPLSLVGLCTVVSPFIDEDVPEHESVEVSRPEDVQKAINLPIQKAINLPVQKAIGLPLELTYDEVLKFQIENGYYEMTEEIIKNPNFLQMTPELSKTLKEKSK